MSHQKLTPNDRRKARVRRKIFGTPERPRLSVYKSNRFLYAQIIDDVGQKTLAAADSLKAAKGANKATAALIGKTVAEKALEKQIKSVVFDRGGARYHGVIKEVADAARKSGLNF